MLKAYTYADQRLRDPRVTELHDSTAARTFPSFAHDLAADGFGFHCERVTAGKADGPVLVSVDEDHIAGAVGPLSVMTDAAGRPFVPPQYFAVHPAYRRRDHGLVLWRAAMAWGRASGAGYKVLQAQAGAPAERFYYAEGLSTLGFTCQREIV